MLPDSIFEQTLEICFVNDCPNNTGNEISKYITNEAKKLQFFTHRKHDQHIPNLFVAYGEFGNQAETTE